MRYLLFFLLLLTSCVTSVEDTSYDTACSNTVGATACDFELIDQNGDVFSLYSQRGKVIVLDISAQWCGPCQYAASTVQSTQDTYGDKIAYISIIMQDNYGNAADLSDIQVWSEYYEIAAPVLVGEKSFLGFSGWYLEAWPTFYYIDQNMVVRSYVRGFAEATVKSNIEELL